VRETAIVTGASSGIGRATALYLARSGYDLGLTYNSNEAGASRTAEDVRAHGRCVAVRRMQLDDAEGIESALSGLTAELGSIAALVNNAGLLSLGPLLEFPVTEWRRVIDTVLTGTFVVSQVVARHMVQSGTRGRIVNVSSVHEAVPLMEGAAYCAAKAGVGMLTKCMALDLAPYGIRVCAVGPGETATPMSGAAEGEDIHARRRPELPIGRPGAPEEIAEAIAYLLSPTARYTTGTTLFVDGGLMLMAAIGNQRTIMASLKGDA
jgi:NAD(P)-dependent dehydrogenase (short-subunit alcohol dehydrogenase family)